MIDSNDEARWLYTALKQVEFLKHCSIGELERLSQQLTKKHFPKGDTLVRQGDPGDYLFLLYSGEVSIQAKSGAFGKKEIVRLGAGSYFGEMALVSREPRSATVVAVKETDAFLLYAADFRKLLQENDELAQHVEDVMSRRKADKELEMRRHYSGASQGLWGKIKKIFGS